MKAKTKHPILCTAVFDDIRRIVTEKKQHLEAYPHDRAAHMYRDQIRRYQDFIARYEGKGI